jgi:OOP family OmpA-OmpF porin
MKKALVAAAIAVVPLTAQSQTLQYPGFYIGGIGGLNWLLNSSFNTIQGVAGVGPVFGKTNANFQTGWAAGGMIGYDFVGPRVEVEAIYRDNMATMNFPGFPSFGADVNQTSVMANVFYDFMAGEPITPYVGAGLGIAFTNASALGAASSSTQFAYQAIIGVGWNIDEQFRVNLDGRYFGTTSPNVNLRSGTTIINDSYPNNNFSIMASLQYKFGSPPAAPPPPPPAVAPPSFMVFFDWDRSNLSVQALNTIQQAATAFKQKGQARITATGHTDTTGSASYNMALSLRRANAVKDQLVREGVPATAITVIGRGMQGLLVQTGPNVREPQNRRVEIVIQ